MIFDVDSREDNKRILGYHPESDSYFVCQSQNEFDSYLCDSEEIHDVTGIECHEQEYRKRQFKLGDHGEIPPIVLANAKSERIHDIKPTGKKVQVYRRGLKK